VVFRVVRVQPDRFAKQSLSLRVPPRGVESAPELRPVLGSTLIILYQLTKKLFSLGEIPLSRQDPGQAGPVGRIGPIEAHGLAKQLLSIGKLPPAQQGLAKVSLVSGVCRVKLDRFPQFALGVIQAFPAE
jgi:hypothetical protein